MGCWLLVLAAGLLPLPLSLLLQTAATAALSTRDHAPRVVCRPAALELSANTAVAGGHGTRGLHKTQASDAVLTGQQEVAGTAVCEYLL